MKDGLKYIVGKEIAAVVVVESKKPRQPRHQVFLLFKDGTRFELYGDAFTCCGGLDKSEGLAGYIRSGGGEVVAVHREPYGRQATLVFSTLDPRPKFVAKAPAAPSRVVYIAQRAWRAAGTVIDWARRP